MGNYKATLRVVAVCMAAATLCAEDEATAEDSRLWILRSHYEQSEATLSGEGIWRFDQVRGTYERVHPLYYNVRAAGAGAYLAHRGDRLLLEGPAYVEFDISPVRVLRRYKSLAAESGLWAFQGVVLTRTAATELGIPAGIYGFPFCANHGAIAPGCGLFRAPGYDQPTANRTRYDLIYRRSLDPSDTALELVKQLPSPMADASINRRFLALDRRRHLFWSRAEGDIVSNSEERIEILSTIRVNSGNFSQEEVRSFLRGIVTRDSPDHFRRASTFAYDPITDSLYETFTYYLSSANDTRFVRLSTQSGREEVLERISGPGEPLVVPIAVAAPESDNAAEEDVWLIPVVADNEGANGTYWRSDVALFNSSDSTLNVTLHSVSTQRKLEYSLSAHKSILVRNILQTLRGPDAAGIGGTADALIVTYSGGQRGHRSLTTWSRTYTGASTGGELSEAVPSLPSQIGYSTHLPSFVLTDDVEGATHAAFILDKRDPARFRHNIGVVNVGPEPFRVRLRYGTLFADSSSTSETEVAFDVLPHSVTIRNVEQLFAPSVIATRSPRIFVVAEKPAAVWLSMIDNLTGAAILIPYELYAFRGDRSRLAIPLITTSSQAGLSFDLFGYFPRVDSADPEQNPSAMIFGTNGCVAQGHSTRLIGETGAPTSGIDGRYWINVFPRIERQLGCNAGAVEMPLASWMSGYLRVNGEKGVSDFMPFYPQIGWPEMSFAGVEISSSARADLGLYNGLEQPQSYVIRAYARDGRLDAETMRTLAAHETVVVPVEQLVGDGESRIYGITVKSGGSEAQSHVWAYVTRIDKRSGDITTQW